VGYFAGEGSGWGVIEEVLRRRSGGKEGEERGLVLSIMLSTVLTLTIMLSLTRTCNHAHIHAHAPNTTVLSIWCSHSSTDEAAPEGQ
jgi:hypothetical protein